MRTLIRVSLLKRILLPNFLQLLRTPNDSSNRMYPSHIPASSSTWLPLAWYVNFANEAIPSLPYSETRILRSINKISLCKTDHLHRKVAKITLRNGAEVKLVKKRLSFMPHFEESNLSCETKGSRTLLWEYWHPWIPDPSRIRLRVRILEKCIVIWLEGSEIQLELFFFGFAFCSFWLDIAYRLRWESKQFSRAS